MNQTQTAREPEPIGELNKFAGFGQCIWIHGNVPCREFRVCGHPAPDGASYCRYHGMRLSRQGRYFP